MHSPCLQILYVCACACICESFFKRVSKLPTTNPTTASTSLLHEAFPKKKFWKVYRCNCKVDSTVVNWDSLSHKSRMTWKTFSFFFLNSEEAGLWNAVSVHMKEHPPPPLSLSLTHKGLVTVAERIERNTNETILHPPPPPHTQKKHKCTSRQLRFRTFFNLLNDHRRELSCMCCIEFLC